MEHAPDIVVIAKEARTRAELESLLGALGYDLEVFDDYPSIESFLPVSQTADLLFIEVSPDTFDQVEGLVKSASEFRRIPVVFLTNNKEESFFSRIKDTRPFGFLPKPLDLGSIRRVVELALLYESSPAVSNGSIYSTSNGVMNASANGRAYLASYSEQKGNDSDSFEGDDAFSLGSYERWVGNGSAPIKYFFTKVGNKLKKVNVDEVLYVEVEGKYSSVHLKEKRYNVKASLKELMEKFPNDRFVRVSRNFIVNLDVVDYIDTVQYVIRLADRDIPVSRTYKEELMNRIRLL